MLKIKNVTKNFGGVKAVDNCNFSIDKGKITALIGPNGSGKTTLFNLVSGILKAEGGEIWFKEHNLVKCAVHHISNLGISRVFQQSRLFKNLTVRENLLLAIDNDDAKFWKNLLGLNKTSYNKEELVKKTLKDFGIAEHAEKLTKDLSFGQKRLAELARTVLNPHELLMLDEPVSGVTPSLRKKITEILLGLKQRGETILLIEHDMGFTFKIADYVVVMDAGKVIAEGTPEQIKNNKAVLEAYLGE